VDARRRSARRCPGAARADGDDVAGHVAGPALRCAGRSGRPATAAHRHPGRDGLGCRAAGCTHRDRSRDAVGTAAPAVPDRLRSGADRARLAGDPAGTRSA
jgi:hypothetical protein